VPLLLLTLNGFITLNPVTERLLFGVGVVPGLANSPSAQNRGVYKSTDGGSTWQLLPGLGFGGSFRLHFSRSRRGFPLKTM
jgi:hypothetical protein